MLMLKVFIFAVLLMYGSAFVFRSMGSKVSRTSCEMVATKGISKAILASVIGTSWMLAPVVRAEIDYDGVKYLGGGEKVDLNNANIRVYAKLPGLYPNIASKIVNGGPFKTVQDVFNIPSLTANEKEALKKVESSFVVMDAKPEYEIDKINNGLYR